jgi:lipopolysaccharide/colanic/teichoic acid biosynthesis glycosyltransferase
LEFFLALLALAIAAPLLVIAALVILAEDGRPILFRQTRIGRYGAPFTILKLRSMSADGRGPAITSRNDPRITKAGRWLRTFKLDELPQLANVLCGEMSLIGPRPEVPEYVEPGSELWSKVLKLRTGITDLATLIFRNEEAILASARDPEGYYRSVILPEKLRLNLQYQQSRSVALDLKLLILTVWCSFRPRSFDRDRIFQSLNMTAKADSRPFVPFNGIPEHSGGSSASRTGTNSGT